MTDFSPRFRETNRAGAAEDVASTIPASTLEWQAVLAGPANVLVEGPSVSTEAIVHAILRELQQPFIEWRPDTPPATSAPLVILAVDRLDGSDQNQLLHSINSGEPNCPRRLLTTCARPLFSLVEDGRFLANLYYRLNVILLRQGDL